MKSLAINENSNSDKALTPKQSILINQLKKVKKEVDNGTFKGQSAKEFLNKLNAINTKQ